jgi:hypothetical protein
MRKGIKKKKKSKCKTPFHANNRGKENPINRQTSRFDASHISMLPAPTAALSFGAWLAELNLLPTAAGTLAS